MGKRNYTRVITWIGIFIVSILLSIMVIGLAGCSTSVKTSTKSQTDSTAVKVVKTDSSGTKSTNETYTKETQTIYRDSLIFIEGKPFPIYVPTQTIIREQGVKQVEETAQKSGSDSGWIKVIEAMQTNQKEKTGIPFTTIVLFSVLGLCLIGLLGIVIYLKVKP